MHSAKEEAGTLGAPGSEDVPAASGSSSSAAPRANALVISGWRPALAARVPAHEEQPDLGKEVLARWLDHPGRIGE